VTGLTDVVVFVLVVLVIAVAGIRIGMLAAPRLDRMTQPTDEDERGDSD
jgi:hypothetical protein